MRLTILGILGGLAMAAFVACSSSSGGTDEGLVTLDPGGPIDIFYGDRPQPDDVIATPDGEDPGTPPADAGDPGTPTDPGKDSPAVDPGVVDNPVAVDPGPADEGPTDPGPPCEYPKSPWGLQDNCDGTMLDTNTQRTWMKGMGFSSLLDDARTYCTDLNKQRYGGFTDWHLPTIVELRELIIGCDANTGDGGACPIVATTILETARTSACDGCGMNLGPVEKIGDPTRKCYMDNTFEWYCNLYWSATQVKASSTGDKRAWYVTFFDAGINVPPSMSGMQSAAIKCVRGP
jgi:hypothetical protein